MPEPLQDPYAGARPRPRGRSFLGALAGGTLKLALAAMIVFGALGITALIVLPRLFAKPLPSVITVRPTPSLLMAIRDVARLETTELHVEKVVDLTDKQSRFFGLVEATDAILLVAVGYVSVGVDLSQMTEGDVSMDPDTGIARLTLPEPQILSTRLDEEKTYVYTRETSALARRNEHLETKARREAVRAIEKVANEGDVMPRAKAQAERQMTALATQLGATKVEIRWKPAAGGKAP